MPKSIKFQFVGHLQPNSPQWESHVLRVKCLDRSLCASQKNRRMSMPSQSQLSKVTTNIERESAADSRPSGSSGISSVFLLGTSQWRILRFLKSRTGDARRASSWTANASIHRTEVAISIDAQIWLRTSHKQQQWNDYWAHMKSNSVHVTQVTLVAFHKWFITFINWASFPLPLQLQLQMFPSLPFLSIYIFPFITSSPPCSC